MKKTDKIPALLTPREAVLNRNAAELLGRDTIKRLNTHGNMLAKRGVDLASDPTPGPSTINMLGYQMGTYDVGRDDRADLLAEADAAFYGGTPMPTPTPTPPPQGYAYGEEDVRKRRTNATDRFYRGININRRVPSADLSSAPRSPILSPNLARESALPPDQNPAYQAATAKGRPSRSGYEMIQTPSGGSMSVPIGQARKYTDLLYKGNPTADTGFQRPNTQASFALGNTGAIPTGNTPFEQSYRMGFQGGAVQRPESPGLGFQIGSSIRNFNPVGVGQGLVNAASRLGNTLSTFFGGGNQQATQYGNAVSTGQMMPPQQASIPRRYSDWY